MVFRWFSHILVRVTLKIIHIVRGSRPCSHAGIRGPPGPRENQEVSRELHTHILSVYDPPFLKIIDLPHPRKHPRRVGKVF